jgi:hypothetical protein
MKTAAMVSRPLNLKSKIRNRKLDAAAHSGERSVQSESSDFGFEMQDSSKFKFISLIYPAGEETSIHRKRNPGNKSCRIRGEEHRGAAEFFGFAKAFHRCAQKEFLAPSGSIKQFFIECRAEDAGYKRVDADAMRSPFDRECFS